MCSNPFFLTKIQEVQMLDPSAIKLVEGSVLVAAIVLTSIHGWIIWHCSRSRPKAKKPTARERGVAYVHEEMRKATNRVDCYLKLQQAMLNGMAFDKTDFDRGMDEALRDYINSKRYHDSELVGGTYYLKPCVRCGSSNVEVARVNIVPEKQDAPAEYSGRCVDCSTRSPFKPTIDEAVKWWNKCT
jgi:hypothetical protein